MPTTVTDAFGNTFETCSISTIVKSTISKDKYASEAAWSKQVKTSAFHTVRAKIKNGEIKPGTIIGKHNTGGAQNLVYKGVNGKGNIELEVRTPISPTFTDKYVIEADKWEKTSSFNSNDWDFGPNLVNLSNPATKTLNSVDELEEYFISLPKTDLPAPGTVLGEFDQNVVKFAKYDAPDYLVTIEYPNGVKSNYYLEELSEVTGGNAKFVVPAPVQPAAGLPVASTSKSVGALTNEDAATLFVKTKDKLATEKGINIKGANPELDDLVYKTIADQAGYTPAEMKAKVEAYKDSGKKLSALKKKVLPKSGNPTKQATAKSVDNAAAAVKKETPAPETVPQVWDTPDVATAYVKAKDSVVANNDHGWTLYTKNPEFDQAILKAVQEQIGPIKLDTMNTAIADYIANHQKLSVLKKQLIKKGELKPQADTLKGGKKPDAPDDPAVKVAPKKTGNGETGKIGEDPKDVSGVKPLTDAQKQEIKDYWEGANLPLSGSVQAIMNAAKSLSQKYGYGDDLLPILRWVDEYKSVKFNAPNKKLYETKVVNHLKNPTPTGYSPPKSQPYSPPKPVVAKTVGELPEDSALFQPISHYDMTTLVQNEIGVPTAAQKRALKTYSGSTYHRINNHMRGGQSYRTDADAKVIQDSMKPMTKDIISARGTSLQALGVSTHEELIEKVGTVFREPAFSSTAVGGSGQFGGAVNLHIEIPKGTLGVWVRPYSNFPSENEYLLSAGTRFQILKVEQKQTSPGFVQSKVYVRVIGATPQ